MKKNKDMIRVMIGSGENSMFMKADVTPRSIDERFEELEKKWKKEEQKDNIKKKVRSLFKKSSKK